MTPLDSADRRRLRSALSSVAPWLTHPDGGPTAVDAGQCDRCGTHPRLLPTCGPAPWRALCRDCGLAVGVEGGWCDGHADEAGALLAWARELPAWWGDAVVLWWVASGEVTPGDLRAHVSALPPPVRESLPGDGTTT